MKKLWLLKLFVLLGSSEQQGGGILKLFRNLIKLTTLFLAALVLTYLSVVLVPVFHMPVVSDIVSQVKEVEDNVMGLSGVSVIKEAKIPVKDFTVKVCTLNNKPDAECDSAKPDARSYRVVLTCSDCISNGKDLTQRLLTINELEVMQHPLPIYSLDIEAGPYAGSGLLITAALKADGNAQLTQNEIDVIRSFLDEPMSALPSADKEEYVWARRLNGPIQYFSYFLFYMCAISMVLNYLSTVAPNQILRSVGYFKHNGKTYSTPWTDNQSASVERLLSMYREVEKKAMKASRILGVNAVFPLTDFRRTAILAFKSSSSGTEVPNFVSVEAEAHRERLEAGTKKIEYLIWLIPTVGFIGTVVGIGDALLATVDIDSGVILTQMIASSQVGTLIGVAFDTTLVSLVLSAFLMLIYYLLLSSHEGMLAFEKRDTLQSVLRIENIDSDKFSRPRKKVE